MTASTSMTIGEVARVSDTPATTLRFYERRGLIEPPERSGGQRRYQSTVIARLMMIKFCRIAGLTLDDIGRVIADPSPKRSVTKELARSQIAAIDTQIAELNLARGMLVAVTTCTCGNVDACSCGAMASVLTELRDRLGWPRDRGQHQVPDGSDLGLARQRLVRRSDTISTWLLKAAGES